MRFIRARELYGKDGAFFGLTGDCNAAAVVRDDLFGDGQAQTGRAAPAVMVGIVAVEDPGQILDGNPTAIVRKGKPR